MASTPSKGSSEEIPPRDGWRKAQTVLAPLAVPLAVGIVGFLTSYYLSRTQERDTRARVYAELITQREQAESSLRKDMFVSIINTFLKPDKPSLDVQVLNMELLAYNFHESLNLKPLFAYIHRTIIASTEAQDQKDKFLDRLEKVAKDIAGKQMLVLEEVGQKFDTTIDLNAVDKQTAELITKTRTLNGIDLTFRLLPLKVDYDNQKIQFRLDIIPPGSSEIKKSEFWVGFYDFPMIDNTRLAKDQRCAVVLNTFEEGHADVTVIYFPGSRASLKEKPFYEDVIANLQAATK